MFGLAPLLFFFIVHYIIPDPAIASKSPGPLLERNRQSISAEDIIISDEATIHAVCWYLKRSNIFVLEDPNELDYGFSYPDAQSRHLDFQSAVSLIRNNPGSVVLIARGKTASRWQDQLPEPLLQDNSGPKGYVIWRY